MDIFGCISAALTTAARPEGTQGEPPLASNREHQGPAEGFELGSIEVVPHPLENKGSRLMQGRIWGSTVL